MNTELLLNLTLLCDYVAKGEVIKIGVGKNEVKGLLVLLTVIIAAIIGINYASRRLSENEAPGSKGLVAEAEGNPGEEPDEADEAADEEITAESSNDDEEIGNDNEADIISQPENSEEQPDTAEHGKEEQTGTQENSTEDEALGEQQANNLTVLPYIAEVLEANGSYVSLAINTESVIFLRKPEESDITLTGELAGMQVTEITQNGNMLGLTLSGSTDSAKGDGTVIIGGDAAEIPVMVNAPVANKPALFAVSNLIMQYSDTQSIRMGIMNDSFSDDIGTDMLSIFGSLSAIKISDIRKNSDREIEITFTGKFLTPMSGDLIFSKEAFRSNSFPMKAFVQSVKPEISATYAHAVSEGGNEYVFTVSMQENREEFIHQLSFYLGGGLAGFSIIDVSWIDNRNAEIKISGSLQGEPEGMTSDGKEILARGEIFITGLYDASSEVLIVK